MTETSKDNNKALLNLNDLLLELRNDRYIIASFLLSPLSKITYPEHTSQLKLTNDPDLIRVENLLINKTIPVNLKNNLLTCSDTDKKFELEGNFLKMITNVNFNVDLDRNLLFEDVSTKKAQVFAI